MVVLPCEHASCARRCRWSSCCASPPRSCCDAIRTDLHEDRRRVLLAAGRAARLPRRRAPGAAAEPRRALRAARRSCCARRSGPASWLECSGRRMRCAVLVALLVASAGDVLGAARFDRGDDVGSGSVLPGYRSPPTSTSARTRSDSTMPPPRSIQQPAAAAAPAARASRREPPRTLLGRDPSSSGAGWRRAPVPSPHLTPTSWPWLRAYCPVRVVGDTVLAVPVRRPALRCARSCHAGRSVHRP